MSVRFTQGAPNKQATSLHHRVTSDSPPFIVLEKFGDFLSPKWVDKGGKVW